MVIWPWAEANQGLLSLLALAAALAIALFEYFRAERAEHRRQRDYVSLVTDLLDGLGTSLDELEARTPTQDVLFSDTVGDWNAHIGKAYQVAEAIIPVVPPNAKLALLMLDIRDFLRLNEIPIGSQIEALPPRIAALRQALIQLRKSAAAHK